MKLVTLRNLDWGRVLIIVKAVLVMASLFYPVWWIHVNVIAGRLPTLPLSLAVSFLGVQVLTILLELFASAVTKKLDARDRANATRFRSVVQRALASHLAGKDNGKELKKMRRRRPVDFDRSVAALLATLRGAARERLSLLAQSLGAVRRWQRMTRIGRQERKHALECMGSLAPEVGRSALVPILLRRRPRAQVATYRAILRTALPEEIDALFREVLRAPLMVRIFISLEFRPHAELLAKQTLPAVLRSEKPDEILAALEMVKSWGRTLDLIESISLCAHPNADVRARAIDVLPLICRRGVLTGMVSRAIEDPDPSVQIAAMSVAARMSLRDTIEVVTRATHTSNDAVCRQACISLGSFGEQGQAALENLIVLGDRRVGMWATEALASARIRSGFSRDVAVYA